MRGRLIGIMLAAAVVAGATTLPARTATDATVARRGATPAAARARATTPARTTSTDSTAPGVRRAAPQRPADTGCVIVRYRSGVTAAQRAGLGTADAAELGNTGLVTKAAPKGMTAAKYAEMLSRSPLVAFAEPDYLLRPATTYTSTPDDPDFNDPAAYSFASGSQITAIPSARSWALHGTYSANFDRVWPALASAEATLGQVHVAVIDTGFYFDHPDRTSNIHAAIDECATYDPRTGKATTDKDCTPVDPNTPNAGVGTASHGTMTAGEVGAAADNAVGTLGAAYDTWVDVYKVMGVASVDGPPPTDGSQRILKGDAIMPVSALVKAIDDAVAAATAHKYRLVISISLELTDASNDQMQSLSASVANARARGAIVVAASGNHTPATSISYPAACPGAISVGAEDVSAGSLVRASYSNFGSTLWLLAPGSHIWGFTKPDVASGAAEPSPVLGYDWWDGTSMATPLAASAAALLLRVEPTLTPSEVASYLASGTVDLSAPGRDSTTGWGALDAYRSYLLLATPRTAANVKARYGGMAIVDFTVSDRDSGTAVTTYSSLDGSATVAGPRVRTDALGAHTLRYWSVDSHGVTESAHTATFTVVPDPAPPVTTADAKATYAGIASVRFTAVDPAPDPSGVAQTVYRLDGAAERSGATVSTGRYGSHTLQFWSIDLAGNREDTHTVTLIVNKAAPSLTLSRSASTIYRNHTVKLSGSLTPARAGDYVRLQFRYPGSSTWHYLTSGYARRISTVSSSGRGSFASLTAKLTRHGRYYFRAYFPGDSTYISRTSRYSSTVSVYVR